MSDSYGTGATTESSVASADSPGTVEVAKNEAAELKDTAAEQAKDVLGTAKDEASSVIGEAKSQAKDLFAQTQREVKDQAQTQQQRIAFGLHAVSDELSSMATDSGQSGVASDLVRNVSGRLSSAATWLGDRDPSSVLSEVKSYARRKPATFILGSLIAGVVVGRLTRALAANASDEKDEAARVVAPVDGQPEQWDVPSPAPAPIVDHVEETPIYAQSTPAWTEQSATEDGDDRRNAF